MNVTDAPSVSPGTPALVPVTRAGLLRVGLHLVLAALPLLAISAHVFGLITMDWSAAMLVIPLATSILALSMFDPHPADRVILHGFVWGMVACALYDVFRLDTVYMLGWWGDFIPTMGTWIVGHDDKVAGAWVGYLWRYLGDGGGIGVTFFAGAAFLGLHRRPTRHVVAAAVAFAVFPVWAGLVATVWLAPRGQTMMFPLTPVTITLSLIGHLIFGLILGLGFVRTRSAHRFWPWIPLAGPERESVLAELGSAARRALPAGPVEPTVRVDRTPTGAHTVPPGRTARGGRPEVAPPALPAGHPSAPFPRVVGERHPSGPLPASGPPSGALSFGPATGGTRVGPSTGATRVGSSAGRSSGSSSGSSSAPARSGSATRTPPEGQTLDPETWALWQRQLATTVKGRRTHRWR